MSNRDRVLVGALNDSAGTTPLASTASGVDRMGRVYLRAMALFYLVFGLITTFYPRLMQLFMTQEGKDASTSFSDQVWLHGGLDIISITILLFILSNLPPTSGTLGAAAVVALMPTAAILYTLFATPFWSALFLVPAAAALAFAVWGFALARNAPR